MTNPTASRFRSDGSVEQFTLTYPNRKPFTVTFRNGEFFCISGANQPCLARYVGPVQRGEVQAAYEGLKAAASRRAA